MRAALLVALAACGRTEPSVPDAPRLAVAPPPDAAVATTAPRPTKQAVTAWKKAMRKGRGLARQDPAAAMAAFDEALAAIPDDPQALSELGWVAFKARKLPEAEAATKRAVAHATSPELKAASLYNLGRIHEELDQNPVAIVAYGQSLKLRANRAVRERLASLDPGAAADADPYRTHPAASVVSLAAFSKQVIDEETLDAWHAVPPRPDLAAPWDEVRFLTTREGDSITACHIALRTSAGWFVEKEIVDCPDESGAYTVAEEVRIDKGLLVIRISSWWEVRESDDDSGGGVAAPSGRSYWLDCEERLVVCGVRPGNAPSCTPAIRTGGGSACDDGDLEPNERPRWTWHARPRVDNGKLVFEVDKRGPGIPADLPGAHVLRF
jgi:hypothetical protein